MNDNTHYTLILGAEGELGRALAREVARRGCNLIIASTSSIDLQRFSIGLQFREEVHVEAIKINLNDDGELMELAHRLKNDYDIRFLINNTLCDWSVPHGKCISEIARESLEERFRGTARMIMEFLPYLKNKSHAYIQHVIPFSFRREMFSEDIRFAAGKMYRFARELDDRLQDSFVSSSMLHANPFKGLSPEFEMLDGLTEEVRYLAPRLVATKAVKGMLKGKRMIIPGFRNRMVYFLKGQARDWLRRARESVDMPVLSTQQSS